MPDQPKIEDFQEPDGGYDYYGFDMAYEQWWETKYERNGMLVPRLAENWCGEQPKPEPNRSVEDLIAQLAA